MPLRYHKQIKLGNLVKLNMNKKSMSVSVGVPGFHFNLGPQGPMINVDLPGGMSYRKYFGSKSKTEDVVDELLGGKKDKDEEKEKKKAKKEEAQAQESSAAAEGDREADVEEAPSEEKPKRSRSRPKRVERQPVAEVDPAGDTAQSERPSTADIPKEEAPFQMAFLAYQRADYPLAYRHFTNLIDSVYQADALFMAGLVSLYLERDDEALTYFATLLDEGQAPLPGEPESLVARYLPDETVSVPITAYTAVDLPLETLTALLLVVELLQADGLVAEAEALLQQVFVQSAEIRLVQLSLADLYITQGRFDDLYNLFMQATPELAAEDDAAVEILYYWAQSLTIQGMFDAADKVYKRALARRKGINSDLRALVMYGAADLYERWGKIDRARKGFEHLLAEAPTFYDVQQRIANLTEPAAEPAQPAKTAEPAQPAEPAQAAQPPETAEPVQDVQPVEPAKPVEPVQPVRPAEHAPVEEDQQPHPEAVAK